MTLSLISAITARYVGGVTTDAPCELISPAATDKVFSVREVSLIGSIVFLCTGKYLSVSAAIQPVDI